MSTDAHPLTFREFWTGKVRITSKTERERIATALERIAAALEEKDTPDFIAKTQGTPGWK